MSTLLKLKNVEKTYTSRGAQPVQALVNISFTVESGEFVAIMGESGSGKSTLLNLIATLDNPTGGEITLNGQDLRKVKEGARAKFRREHLGFIFQDFDLLDTFNVQDNIFLPLVLAKKPLAVMKERLAKLAPRLGISDLLQKYPYELSGGQQQRVAAARAMITEPEILLADEPTGALDSKTSSELLDLLTDVNAQSQQTILMVTHSAIAASHSKRVLFIRDGQIFHQLYRGELDQPEFLTRISETMTAMLTKEGEGQ
ncbi:ABC transporter ATP-binding protein [Lacticaseibacillus casei]|uniref:ABC transporter ATP-binding protein n=1 Tax=Lacticaseibacillus casei TaxID=1582 RepID=UPI001107CAA0|nr:ABC transporter ATP-binding protein [Lacticaseibacillus casei]TLQ52115.1 ABC transporter ATP-binding protein [Lacticaseibacillus casei]